MSHHHDATADGRNPNPSRCDPFCERPEYQCTGLQVDIRPLPSSLFSNELAPVAVAHDVSTRCNALSDPKPRFLGETPARPSWQRGRAQGGASHRGLARHVAYKTSASDSLSSRLNLMYFPRSQVPICAAERNAAPLAPNVVANELGHSADHARSQASKLVRRVTEDIDMVPLGGADSRRFELMDFARPRTSSRGGQLRRGLLLAPRRGPLRGKTAKRST